MFGAPRKANANGGPCCAKFILRGKHVGGRRKPFFQNMSTQLVEKTLITTALRGQHGIITRHLLKFDILACWQVWGLQ